MRISLKIRKENKCLMCTENKDFLYKCNCRWGLVFLCEDCFAQAKARGGKIIYEGVWQKRR